MVTQFRPEQANLTKYWDHGSGTMRVPSGTGFPAGPNDGDIFYRTDEDLLYIYDGAAWESWLVHDVVGAGHTTVGAQWDVVGLTGVNTLGLLTPSADVSAGAEALLKSTAAGDLALHDLTATGQLSAGAGIAEGLFLGGDAQWYRSAADMLRTPDSVTIDVGLNVGTTGAGAGQLKLADDILMTDGKDIHWSDVNLYRDAADVLKTDDSFTVGGTTFTSVDNTNLGSHDASILTITGVAVTIAANSVFTWGTDTTLYRSAANLLKTDDSLEVALGLNIGTATGATTNQIAIGAAPSSKLTVGVTINQGANDDEALVLQSSDVSQPLVSVADADTYATFKKVGGSGGLAMRGFHTATSQAILMAAYLEGNAVATKTNASLGIITLYGLQVSGDALADTVANGNVVAMRTQRSGAIVTLWILDEDGDVYIDGTQNTYDQYDDAVMAWDATRVLANRGAEILRYNKDALVRAGIMSPAGWISQRGTTKLLMGAVGQLWQRNQELCDYRLVATTEREEIREQIGVLQNRLAVLERAA